MDLPLIYLSYLAFMFFFGIILALIADKIKISKVILLLILGAIIGNLDKFKYDGLIITSFPDIFKISIAIIALVMIIFTGTTSLKFKELDRLSLKSIKLFIIFMFLSIVILGFFSFLLFGLSTLSSIIFAILMSGTATDAIFALIKKPNNKTISLLTFESIFNTPFIVVIPLLILQLANNYATVTLSIVPDILKAFLPFLQQIIVGIGAGVFLGIVAHKILKKTFSAKYGPLAVFTMALLSYSLSEIMGGSGILGVSAFGIFFGNIAIKEKEILIGYSSFLTEALEVLVFILIGSFIMFVPDVWFYVKILIMFLIYLVVRYASIYLAFNHDINFRERIFMTLVSPKGIGVAATLFLLSLSGSIVDLSNLINISLMMVLLSIVTATIAIFWTDFFLRPDSYEAQKEAAAEKKAEDAVIAKTVQDSKTKEVKVTKAIQTEIKKAIKKTDTSVSKKVIEKATKEAIKKVTKKK